MILNAKHLLPEQKAAIETLLGRPVHAGEAISIRTFEPATVSNQRKIEIADELRNHYVEVDASRRLVSDEEAEEIITGAMQSVRPGYRPQ